MNNERQTIYLAMEIMGFTPVVKKETPYKVLAWKASDKIIRLSDFDPYHNIDHAVMVMKMYNDTFHIDFLPDKDQWFVQNVDGTFYTYHEKLAAAISDTIYRAHIHYYNSQSIPKI